MTPATAAAQNVSNGLVVAATPNFVPASEFAELEAARAAHERALEEHMSQQARRREAREQERQLQEHLATVQQSQKQSNKEATDAVKAATIEALQVVAEHGEAWLAKIAAERAEALAEHDELIARAAQVKARAHANDTLEVWLMQATSESVPQPFGAILESVAS